MGAVLAPQTSQLMPASTSPTARDLRTLVGEQRHDDLGQLCPAHGERGAKPLESCSCWLLCVVVVFCVVACCRAADGESEPN
jgi:hypothetical protein